MFLFASTTARTSNALLGWNCGFTFTSNVMYGVLYAVSPELFPTKDRGTGNAIVASANRVFGIMVRVLLPYYRVPVLTAGALWRVPGAYYRSEGQFSDVGAHLGVGRTFPCFWLHLAAAAIRAKRKGVDLRTGYLQLTLSTLR